VFRAVDAETCLIIAEDSRIINDMLVDFTPVVIKFGEVPLNYGPVQPYEELCGVCITNKSRGGVFLAGQASANLMSSFKYADTQATILGQIHANRQCLGSTTNYYCVVSRIRHPNLL